jgi:hypothetical protein
MRNMLSLAKPLLTDEEFAEVVESDDDDKIWLALLDAARNNDPAIHQVFRLSEHRGWSRFRTLMVCVYVMAQRHERMAEREMDRLLYATAPPTMVFCAKCAKELHLKEDTPKA